MVAGGVPGVVVLVTGVAVELLGTAVVEIGAAVVVVGGCVELGVAVVAAITAGQGHTCLRAAYSTLNREWQLQPGTDANQDDKLGSKEPCPNQFLGTNLKWLAHLCWVLAMVQGHQW